MKKIILTLILLTASAVISFAQVNREELSDLPPVVFINYEGPHAWVNTREEIRQIGVGIGRQVNERERGFASAAEGMTIEQRRSQTYTFQIGASNRYFIIHCVSAPDGDKLDADILGLGVDAGVDHVRNLRVIIQGYLQSAYDYSASDALLLAEFITVYNAVYRGNWDYFTGRYKNLVMSNLTRERAGLSIRYDEWPGRTLLVIPLGHGGLSSIDTAAISDRRVIEEMRREDDQGVPQRQGLVDLMEREADQAERQAQAQREQIRQEERQVAEERAQTAQERQQIQDQRQQTQEDLEAGRITEQEARQQEQELASREEAVQQQEQETARREEQIDQRRDEAQRLEDFAEQRTEQAQQQRQEIASDQQAAIVQETAGGVLGVTIERTAPVPMGRLVRLNPVNRREIRRSPLDMVHSRTVMLLGGRIFAIAGEARGQGAVRLIEINQTSLEMLKQGENDIRAGSLIWATGNDMYAIMVENGRNYIGRFDLNLALQAKSSVEVHNDASVLIQQGNLLTQRPDGTALILNPADLTEPR